MQAQSALVVLVPEAEGLVGPFRDRFDASAAAGMPAHITVLFPFVSPNELGPGLLDGLSDLFASSRSFRFILSRTRRFAQTIYLAPEPDEPFRALTLAVWNRYPDLPPYGGQHSEVIPHLTVGHFMDDGELKAVSTEFQRAARAAMPIGGSAKEISLMENSSGRWRCRAGFRLGNSTLPDNIALS
jgi:hypothetical protein